MDDDSVPGRNPGRGADPTSPEPAGDDPNPPAWRPPDAPPPGQPDATPPEQWLPPEPSSAQLPSSWRAPDQPTGPGPGGWGAPPASSGGPAPGGWAANAGGGGSGSGPTLLIVGCLLAVLLFGVVPILGLALLGSQISTILSTAGSGIGETTAPAASGTTVNVFNLDVGDCFDEPGGASEIVNDLLVLPCDAAHTYELIAVVELPNPHGATYPGIDQIRAAAREQCGSAFAAYVGTTYEDSTFDVGFYTVTEEGWNSGDRSIDCLAGADSGGRFSGSVKGANR